MKGDQAEILHKKRKGIRRRFFAIRKKMVVVVEEEEMKILVREFQPHRDAGPVEEMERQCEVGSSPTTGAGKNKNAKTKKKAEQQPSLFVDQLGDPISRVRHSPDHVMLVAESYGEKKEMVGVIRACIKTVTTGRKAPVYAKVAYILGLRVSPTHRRLGIGTRLVEKVEEWCKQKGAEYAYMATDRSNSASLNLFVMKRSYARFRSPVVLVQPVHSHSQPLSRSATIIRLSPALANSLYRRLFSSSAEFFPADIASVLSNPLTLGTFMAIPSSSPPAGWDPNGGSGSRGLPRSFALMSLWNSKKLFRLQVKGVSAAARAALWCARAADERAPWLRIPSLPDVFRPFGVYFMYGLHMEGEEGPQLMKGLCRMAHNMARKDEGCAAVVTEVGATDPVRSAVPHWKRFSWDEDIWCMKSLSDLDEEDDWVRSQPSTNVIFADPRDF